jgi:hypothetical protein
METPLTFEYDEVGDILHVNKVPPYAGQESDHLEYNVVARRNPRTGAIENLEVLFFTRWLLKHAGANVNNLRDLFAEPAPTAVP